MDDYGISSLGGNVSNKADDNSILNQPSDKTGQVLVVGPLQPNNGGLVSTHAITSTSPAYHAALAYSPAISLPPTDANNQPRICPPDAGAFEVPGDVPLLLEVISSNGGTLTCGSPSLVLMATASGGSSFTYVFAGPGLSTTATSNTASVSQSGTFTVTARNADGCAVSNTITVSGSPNLMQGTNAVAGLIVASGPAGCGAPARLTASATGSSFVFTGPGGYVFSNTYRNAGSYTAFAEGVKLGGTYTLTVSSSEGCPSVSSTVVVPGPTSCP